MSQVEMFDALAGALGFRRVEEPAPPRKRTPAERAAEFHLRNPKVYAALRRLALEAVAIGRTRLGIGEIWEVARWQLGIEARDADGYKLNNSYRAWYARELMRREPLLSGRFSTRERRS